MASPMTLYRCHKEILPHVSGRNMFGAITGQLDEMTPTSIVRRLWTRLEHMKPNAFHVI